MKKKATIQDLYARHRSAKMQALFNRDPDSAYSSATLPLQAHFGIGLDYVTAEESDTDIADKFAPLMPLPPLVVLLDVLESRVPSDVPASFTAPSAGAPIVSASAVNRAASRFNRRMRWN